MPSASLASASIGDSDKTVISQRPVAAPEEFYRSMPLSELANLLEGKQLDHFQVEQMIGGGGMGAVFRGRDLRLDRIVAIKVIPASKRDADTLRRFRLEAQSAARLDHPNIARVYYVGEAERWNYIVFEFIDGVNIRDLVDMQGPLSVDDAVFYTRQVAEALQHAADRNVVHRDIKPSNLLVTAAGAAKVVDMGLARDTSLDKSSADATASGVTLGTFDYISPEQARNPRDADVRSDLYSLGCTLFFMLTGNPPFPEGTALQKLLNHGSQPPPDPRAWREDLSDELYEILMKLMAKRPSDRYQKPVDLINDLLLLAEAENLPRSRSPGTVLMTPSVAQRSLLEANLPWMVAVAALLGTTLWMQSVKSLSSTFPIPPALFAASGEANSASAKLQPNTLQPTSESASPTPLPESSVESAKLPPFSESTRTNRDSTSNPQANNSLPINPPTTNSPTNNPPANNSAANNSAANNSQATSPQANQQANIPQLNNSQPVNPQSSKSQLDQPSPLSDLTDITQFQPKFSPFPATSENGAAANLASRNSSATTNPTIGPQTNLPTTLPASDSTKADASDLSTDFPGDQNNYSNSIDNELTGSGTPRTISTLFVSNRIPTGVDRQAWTSSLADALRRAEIETDIRTIELVGRVTLDSAVRIARPDLTIRSGASLGASFESSGQRATLEFAPSLLARVRPGESLIEIGSQSLQCLDLNIDLGTKDPGMSTEALARDVSLFGVGPGGKLDLDGCRITVKGTPLTSTSSVITISDNSRWRSNALLSNRFDDRNPRDTLEPSSIAIKNSVIRGEASLIKVTTSQRIEIETKQLLVGLTGLAVDVEGVESEARKPPFMRLYCQHTTFVTAEGFARIQYLPDSPPSLAINRNSKNCVYWSLPNKPHFFIDGVQRSEDLDDLLHLQGGENAYEAKIELLCKCLSREEAEVPIQFSNAEAPWFQEYGNEWSISWQSPLPQPDTFNGLDANDFDLRAGMFMPGFAPANIAPTLVD